MAELIGTPNEELARAEQIVQAIVPEATCDIHSYYLRCGFPHNPGYRQFTLPLSGLDSATVEAGARAIKVYPASLSG